MRIELSKLVGVNERGQRVGEDRQGAVLTNEQVDLVFQMHDDEDGPGWGTRRIAKALKCSRSLVQKIVQGKIRTQYPVRYKRV